MKGDKSRISTVVAEKPFMGLVPESTTSWSEKVNHKSVSTYQGTRVCFFGGVDDSACSDTVAVALGVAVVVQEYQSCNVNSCWELYGVKDQDHFPSTGGYNDMRITTTTPGAIDWKPYGTYINALN